MKTRNQIKSGMLSLAVFFITTHAWADTITVAPSGGDYTTIQAAIDAANPGDTIVIAAGTYSEELTLGKALTVEGANAGVAAGANPGSRGAETIVDGGFIVSAAATIDGLTIQNGRTSGSVMVGVAVATSGVTVTNCIIEDVGTAPLVAQSDGLSTQTGNNNLTLTNSTIQNNWRGIYLNPGDGHTFTGNLIDANNGVGVGIGSDGQSNLTLTGNTISNNSLEGWGASSVGANVAASGNTFTNNGVSIAHYGGDAIDANDNYWGTATPDFGTLVSGNVTTDTWYTDAGLTTIDSSLPVENTSQNTFFSTIADALTASADGDTIEVEAGSYGGFITITKPITLLGANAGIDAVTGTRAAEAEITGMVTVTADDVTIDGFSLTNPSGTIGVYAKRCSRLTVENNIIHDINSSGTGSAAGVYVLGDNSSTGSIPVADVTIANNYIHTIGSLASTVSTKGIYFGDSNGISTVSNVLVQGNKIETVLTTRGAYGITLNYGYSSTGTADNVQILDNIVTDLEGLWVHGIGLETNTTATVVQGNEISNLRDNKTPSDAVGIFFEGNPSGASVVVSENVLRSSMGWGVAIHPDDISAYGYSVDASANYWDSTDGPGGVGSGTGTATGLNVGYSSYFADATLTNLLSSATWVDDDFTDATPGWGLDHFATVQDGIDHAIAGGTVNVADGIYNESPLINKSLTLQSVGGRDVTTIVLATGQNDNALTIEGAGNDVTVQGFTIVGRGSTTNVTVEKDLGTVNITDNRIQVGSSDGGFDAGIGMLTHSTTDSDTDVLNVSGNTFDVLGSDGERAFYINPGVDQFVFQNNQILGNFIKASIAQAKNGLVQDNTVTGNGSSAGLGTWGYPDPTLYGHTTFQGNTISGTSTAIAIYDSQNISIEENDLSRNETAVAIRDYGSAIPPDISTISVTDNNLTSTVGLDNGFATAVDSSPNWWGAADGPNVDGSGPGSGALIEGPAAYSPWWADAAMTILAYDNGNFGEDYTVHRGETLEIPETLTITGGTFLVDGGTLIAGELDLRDGATLDVVDGTLTIGGSTISGSFTFFNSFGSVEFNDDIAIAGSAEGLILISDVHVANGVDITVDGTLVIDGCTVDSEGRFTLTVNAGANFTMARTIMTNGDMTISADDTKIYDNQFENSTIAVTTGTTGAKVYHNITDSPAWLTDTGTGTVTDVDSWGNVASAADTHNNLPLGLDLGTLADGTNGRTMDTDGNVFIHPLDTVTVKLDVAKLQAKITAVEVLLGYNSDYFTATSLGLTDDWDVVLAGSVDPYASGIIGKFDTAIGLSFDFTDAEGTDAAQTFADVALTGTGSEGETVFFHRVKLSSDVFPGETRLTTGGPSPSYLTPFTANSGSIISDGSLPEIDEASSNGTQEQPGNGTVDVLDPAASPLTPNYVIRNGNPVILTFTATDAGLAGLDAPDATADLVLTASNGTTTLGSADYTVTAVEAAAVVTYTVTLNVPVTATTGTYAVTAKVRDRSGNWSGDTALGSFQIASEVLATVELEAFEGGLRDVVFTATGGAAKTWTKTVTFTGALGTAALEDVPDGTTAISAKTAWNLRSKLAVSFSPEGVGAVSLTGADNLPGGDITGDNVVNTLDFSVLRYHWMSAATAADITGNNVVNVGDYNVLKGNFYTTGDPE